MTDTFQKDLQISANLHGVRNGANLQKFSVYQSDDGAGNWARLNIGLWNGAGNWGIWTENAGSVGITELKIYTTNYAYALSIVGAYMVFADTAYLFSTGHAAGPSLCAYDTGRDLGNSLYPYNRWRDLILYRDIYLGGSFKGGLSTAVLLATTLASVVKTGGTGTTWGYKVTTYGATGETIASAEVTASNAAVLDVSNYNTITITRVVGVMGYKVYRTTAGTTPSTLGLIGTVLQSNLGTNPTLVDNALAATGGAAQVPAVDASASVTENGLKRFCYSASVNDDAIIYLPAITNAGRLSIQVGNLEEWAECLIDNDGDVTLLTGLNSTNVVAGADTDTKFCVGTGATQEPLAIKNRLGAAKNVNLVLWYN
jgi:hypothetical protein